MEDSLATPFMTTELSVLVPHVVATGVPVPPAPCYTAYGLCLLLCDGSLGVQVVCASLWAVFWFFAIKYLVHNILVPWVSSQAWKDQWVEFMLKPWADSGIPLPTTDEAIENGCFGAVQVFVMHSVGTLFCLPSVFGASGSVVSALACHGGLSEAGWDLYDCVHRAYGVLSGDNKLPKPLLFGIALHHAMSLIMVIPMNILYRDSPYYHQLVFLLHSSALFVGALQNYGFALDVKTDSGLRRMKVCVTLTAAAFLWSRGFRYVFIGYKLMSEFYVDGSTKMLCAGGLVLVLMGLCNLAAVVDSIKKCAKFMRMRHEDEDAHDDITRTQGILHRDSKPEIIMSKGTKGWAKVDGTVNMDGLENLKKEM